MQTVVKPAKEKQIDRIKLDRKLNLTRARLQCIN